MLLLAAQLTLAAQRRTRGEPDANWKEIDKAIPKTTLKLSNNDVARTGLTAVVSAFRTSHQTALDSALVLLSAEQKTLAAPLLTAHSANVDEMLREKTGGR